MCAQNNRKDSQTLAIIAVITILSLTGVLVWGEPRLWFPNDDVTVYGVVAKLWGMGEVPYRDVVDHKPPFVYLFYRVCFWLGGVEPRSLWQGFTLLTGVAAAALILGFRSLRLTTAGLATALGFFYIFTTDALSLREPAFLNTELLASGLLAIALALILLYQSTRNRCWVALSGVMFGCAILTKQPSALFALAFATHLTVTHWSNDWRATLRQVITAGIFFSLGSIAPIALCVAWFAQHGALQDLWFWAHTANLTYAGISFFDFGLRLSIAQQYLELLTEHLSKASSVSYALALLITPVVLLVRRSRLDLITLAWIASGIITCLPNRQLPHSHYLLFFQVPLALVVGSAVQAIVDLLNKLPLPDAKIWATPVVVCAALFFQSNMKISDNASEILEKGPPTKEWSTGAELRASMAEIEKYAESDKRLLFFGQSPMPLFYTNLIPASKYIYFPPDNIITKAELTKEFLAAYEQTKPSVALIYKFPYELFQSDGPGMTQEIGAYLREHYESLPPMEFGWALRRHEHAAPVAQAEAPAALTQPRAASPKKGR
jgi:hypothetical protein